MSRKAALDWAAEQREWVEAQLGAMLPAEPFVPGAIIPLEGRDGPARVDCEALPRTPKLDGESAALRRARGWLRADGSKLVLKRRALGHAVSAKPPKSPAAPESRVKLGRGR